VPLDEVLSRADVLFVGTPHAAYRNLVLPPDKVVVDVWSSLPRPAARKGENG
jgi:hypothetical protein